MKLYTRTGDDGTTGLFGGQRVSKDHPRVVAYGTVDELNACVGLAATACDSSDQLHQRFLAIFLELQSRLFDIGADLATPHESKHENKITRTNDEHVAQVERWIDEIDAGNQPMKHFILPGGTELAARLHFARTVCRRAERAIISLSHAEPVTSGASVYINRVSDLLFAMARRANAHAGIADIPWQTAKGHS